MTVTNVREAPVKATILATGETIDFELEDNTLTFVIPQETASSNLDVIKMEWK